MGNFVSINRAKQGSILSVMMHPKNLSGSCKLIWKEYTKHKIILLQLISILNLKGEKMV